MNTSKYRGRLAAAALFVIVGLALAWGASPQGTAADQKVKQGIEKKLQKHGIPTGVDVQVTVEGQTITLTGSVANLAIRNQAGRDAASAGKKYKVVNDLAIPKSDLTPQQIGQAVADALWKSDSYGIFDWVGLTVSPEGVVTLKGWVYLTFHADDFVKIAESQPGVTEVKNELQPVMRLEPDNTIRLQAAVLIYRTPRQASFSRMTGPVHILVENAVVTLVGTVEKEADIHGYESLIRTNTGAVNIINELRAKSR